MADLAGLLELYGVPRSSPTDFGLGDFGSSLPSSRKGPGYLSGFLQSAVGSIPEVIGMEPNFFGLTDPEEVRQFRNENPIGGVASQLAGLMVPYAGGYSIGARALAAVPKTARMMAGIGEMAKTAPLTARAAREVVTLLPFEAGRLALTSMAAPDKLGEIAISAGLDLALAPAIGVGLQFGRSLFGTTKINKLSDEIKKTFPDFDLDAPRQNQLAQLQTFTRNADKTLTEPIADQVTAFTQKLSQEIRLEQAPRAVGQLENGSDGKELRRVFSGRGESDSSVVSKKLIAATKHFPTTEAWQKVAAEAGLPEGWESAVQFPRLVELRTQPAARQVGNLLREQLDYEVQNGWLMQREAGDGLFVLAKKLRGATKRGPDGRMQATGPTRWVMLKTNDPDKFIGKTVFGEAVKRRNDFGSKMQVRQDAALVAQSELATNAYKLQVDMPWQNFSGPGLGRVQTKIVDMMPESIRNAGKEVFDARARVFKLASEYLAPAMQQFIKSPRAGWTMQSARAIFDMARARADVVMYGTKQLNEKRSLFRELFAPQAPGGIVEKIAALKGSDLPLVTNILSRDLATTDLKALGASKEVQELFEILSKEDTKRMGELEVIQKLTGSKMRALLPQEYSLARSWRGDFRLELRDSEGRLVELASGITPIKARDNANEIRVFYAANGKKLSMPEKKPWVSDAETDLDWARLIDHSARLKTLPPDLANKGFLSKKDLAKVIKAQISTDNLRMAEMLTRHTLSPHLIKLAQEDLKIFGAVSQRINDLASKPTKFSKMQNELTDKLLAPVLGKNSATKLVAETNKFMHHMALGSANLMFPTMNVIGVVQTVLPHLAFIKGAAPESVARLYTQSLVGGADGRPRGFMSVLSPLKIAAETMKQMKNPDEELRKIFARANSDNLLTGGFTEEFVGQTSSTALKIKSVMSGETGVLDYLEAWSNILPAGSERMARGFAFISGYNAFKNWYGLADEQLYQAAKQFTQRTMYMYSTADRPRVLTGPLGSSLGFFKNWLFHNMADWSNYSGEAFLRGNFAPLLWAFGGTAALGGIGAVPLYGLADGASRILTDKSIMQQMYEGFGGSDGTTLVDSVYFGIPAFAGLSLQANASGPFSNPMRDFSFLFSWALGDQMAKGAKATGYMMDQWFAQGKNPLVSDRTVDLFAYAFGPRTFYKGLAQVEDGALKSIRNGRPVIEGVTNLEYAMNTFGLTPLKIAKAYELSEELWQKKETHDELQRIYGEAWYQAQLRNDSRAMQDILQKSVARGVDLSGVFKSAASRQRLEAGESLDSDFKSVVDASLRRTQMGVR